MGFSFDWIDANWFALLQTAGIVSGFAFTGISIRRESRTRRVQNLLTITEHHRSIWQQVFEDANLLRVLKRRANLRRRPVTLQERIFVNLIILHLTALLAAMRAKEIAKPAGLDYDLKDFFSKPIPWRVWQATLHFRDEPTRTYVEALLRKPRESPVLLHRRRLFALKQFWPSPHKRQQSRKVRDKLARLRRFR